MAEICAQLPCKAGVIAGKSSPHYQQNAPPLPPQCDDSDIRPCPFYFQSKSLCFSFIFYTFAHAERKCYEPNCRQIDIDDAWCSLLTRKKQTAAHVSIRKCTPSTCASCPVSGTAFASKRWGCAWITGRFQCLHTSEGGRSMSTYGATHAFPPS